MAVTKNQLKEIEDAILRRFLGFTLDSLDKEGLTVSQLAELKRLGLIRKSVKHLTVDPYVLGKVVALVQRTTSTKITYDEIMSAIKGKTPHFVPLTGVETEAISYASANAGAHITGIMHTTLKHAHTSVARARTTALNEVQNEVASAIANRKTISELKTALFNRIDDSYRDWKRVAHTEMNNAVQNGIYERIRAESPKGGDQLVFKRPAPNACRYCKRLHLHDDGVTPRVFKLSELAQSNIGLKPIDWVPTIGGVHPWCHCQLVVIPEGYSFKIKNLDEEGVEIPDPMLEEYGDKIQKVAVLSYTEETISPDGAESYGSLI